MIAAQYIMIEILHLILFLTVPLAIAGCLGDSRNRQKVHLDRRQALRERQRFAVLSGRSVRSVIETEVDSDSTQCSKFTCVRMAPRLKEPDYERMDFDNETAIDLTEKPSFVMLEIE
uniref:Uncharacterized protein n=1 Tax=Caenorhabditis japonica TaxID=281687 RepID=A0A8R1DMY8_CAEJA